MRMRLSGADGRWRFSGKEWQAEPAGLPLLDFGARMYDPATASWLSQDPMAEKYPSLSPYSYCAGDPVNLVDPDGRDWFKSNDGNTYLWKNDPNSEIDGFSYLGPEGTVLGSFERDIDILMTSTFGIGSLFTDGRSFEIADNKKGASRMFAEFLNNTGSEITILTSEHPYTQVLMNSAKSLDDEKKFLAPSFDYYPAHSFGLKGLFEAGVSVPLQFIGSYRHDMNYSPGGEYINHIVSDSKSRTSLFYHLPKTNKSRSESRMLGNTYQFYIWSTFNRASK